ncbi:hypothetical protein [Vibrio nigripulchritudo]|uniref:hypothetical protein n=1 Tax=Vibrio nigripulchritudo TaxID=28173 RepID=UPI00190CF68A|nr:hypothetical protein [Vibrio nigripulchritudo]
MDFVGNMRYFGCMNVADLSSSELFALIPSACLVGFYIPLLFARFYQTKFSHRSEDFFTLYACGVVLLYLPVLINFFQQIDQNLPIGEMPVLNAYGLIVMGVLSGVWMPLTFVSVYRESWHTWSTVSRVYFVLSSAIALCLFLFFPMVFF